VFVKPQTGFSAHAVRAVLTLVNGGKETELEASLTPRAASKDEDRASTFNFEVAPELLGDDTAMRVTLEEKDCDLKRKLNPNARFPAAGSTPLQAERVGKLRVVLLPIKVGSFVPDTGTTQVSTIREALKAQYPVAEVEVTVAPAVTWTLGLSADGTGWSELLNEIRRKRQRDSVDRDIYYYGLVSPKGDLRSYCGLGCILGLAPQTSYVSPTDQVALGVGFVDDSTYNTAVHELGHAHGRGHAPCVQRGGSIQGVDRNFPQKDGSVGNWGWDSRSDALIEPTAADVMGYCSPSWISDYTYAALAERSLAVNTSMKIQSFGGERAGQAATWQSLILYADGSARWAGVSTDEVPLGEREPMSAFDAQGNKVAEREVARVSLSHSSDSFLYIPEPQADWAELEFGGTRLNVASILPALP
jgi:hypothetical protein